MTKKTKKIHSPLVTTELCSAYLNLLNILNNCHEEYEFDSIRKQMNELWSQMSVEDKRCFGQLSH